MSRCMDEDNINSTINVLLNNVINNEKFYQIIIIVDIDKYVKRLRPISFKQIMIVAQMNKVESLTHLISNS